MRAFEFAALVSLLVGPLYGSSFCKQPAQNPCKGRTLIQPAFPISFPDLRNRILSGLGGPGGLRVEIHQLGSSGFYVIDAFTAEDAEAVRGQLSHLPPDFFVTPPAADVPLTVNQAAVTPNDALWPHQDNMKTIGADRAWQKATDSRGVVVAVIDSGAQLDHEDLKDNLWRLTTPFSFTYDGASVPCSAGDHGYDAIDHDCIPDGKEEHGTHVAGIIGAKGNAIGVAGVSWDAEIMFIRAFRQMGDDLVGCSSDVIEGLAFILEARKHGANVCVVNASWGATGQSAALKTEIEKVVKEGILFVAAAGNCHNDNDMGGYYPASWSSSIPNMIDVVGSNASDDHGLDTNFGPKTAEIAAPGWTILSTVPVNRYDYLWGTSMAAAHVSGAAALVMAKCGLTAAQAKDLLLKDADRVQALGPYVQDKRRLNVGAAIEDCAAVPASSPARH